MRDLYVDKVIIQMELILVSVVLTNYHYPYPPLSPV